jgi:uncharacterized protein YlxW (UPF0749 family)
MNKNKLIQEQYRVESTPHSNHSPLSTGSDLVAKHPQDYDLVRVLQRQIATLQQEIRRLHNRHKELHSEVARLRSQIK